MGAGLRRWALPALALIWATMATAGGKEAGWGGVLTDQRLPQRGTRYPPAFTRALDPGFPKGAVSRLPPLTRHVTKEAAFVQQAKNSPPRPVALCWLCERPPRSSGRQPAGQKGGAAGTAAGHPLRPSCGALPALPGASPSLPRAAPGRPRPGGLSPALLSPPTAPPLDVCLGRAVQRGGAWSHRALWDTCTPSRYCLSSRSLLKCGEGGGRLKPRLPDRRIGWSPSSEDASAPRSLPLPPSLAGLLNGEGTSLQVSFSL